ncbi:restriction endonuclease [Dactylosporangium sp. NPDC048998]|uniref:restriction endonuclease n=1 Tax=Dactylosporangium sp. NPDC048998 TaxID=3363976 RepID=UPI0037137F48
MPEFDVEVSTDDARLAELCSMYWTTSDDGSFTYTVKALSEQFGQPSHKVSKIVAEACFARSRSRRCSECKKGFIYRSRSDWTSGARFGPTRCRTCSEADKRQQEEERERLNAIKRASILECCAVSNDGITPDAADLDLSTALALAALLEDAEEISGGIITALENRTDRLTPTSDYDHKLLEALIDKALIQVHPSSPPQAFTWKPDGTLEGFYPTAVSYYLSGTGSLEGRIDAYLASLTQVISREAWPDHWVEQFSELWFDVATSECKAYLVHLLKRHGLDFTPGQKTDDVFRQALKWFSIGQMYYFIWRAARDSAAYLAREKVQARQAANSAITRISADVERAYAQGWQVNVYQRDARLPLSTLSHILFSRALKLDNSMAYSPIDLPVRRAGLELAWTNIDSESFERLIFQLVVETEGYENVDWLMQTNAPDHGRDVSAVRLRRDPLSGHSSQRVAIQCKHWLSRSIRDVDVNTAIVSVSHWQDPPFDVVVIATSGRFTSDAVAWIERHNSRGNRPSIELWNDARLEYLLNERPHLIRTYELR